MFQGDLLKRLLCKETNSWVSREPHPGTAFSSTNETRSCSARARRKWGACAPRGAFFSPAVQAGSAERIHLRTMCIWCVCRAEPLATLAGVVQSPGKGSEASHPPAPHPNPLSKCARWCQPEPPIACTRCSRLGWFYLLPSLFIHGWTGQLSFPFREPKNYLGSQPCGICQLGS